MYPARTHSAPSPRESDETALGPENKGTKHAKTPIATNTLDYPTTHPLTDPTTHQRTNLPTHDVLQQYSRADALIETEFSCCDTGISKFLRFSATPGSEQTRPREGTSPRSPLIELGTAPVVRWGQRRAAVWDGHGATARPWEAKWRSGVAAVFWVCYNKHIVEDPFGHHHYYLGALYYTGPSSGKFPKISGIAVNQP